ncbi:AsmA family protein [Flavobacterium sp. ZT3R18]|uniref:AsmA family protein n=1 Tax=Flavobacterium sp. ZT3R18 TaxID=2594429 RepID=UPI001179C352|nr:AsmA family protein [Flavobacterium sp. ZT3R18]TRX33999.1 AsmA family protein [Flavobacterium sp. ZT3R18]
MNQIVEKRKAFLKTNRFRKVLKIIGYFCIGFIGLLLVFFIGLRVYFNQNKSEIMTEINQKINDNILGHASIGDVGYKFLIGFPNFTVVLNKVELRDSLYAIHKRSVLKAEEIEVRLNVLSLLNKKVAIEKVVLIDTKIDLFKDKNGVSNSNIFKPKPKTNQPKSKTETEIDEVDFKNVVFISQNLQRNKLFHFEVAFLKSKINYTDDGWQTDLFLDVFAKSMAFNTIKGSFIKDKRVQGKLAVQFSKEKNRIDVLTEGLGIGEDDFDIKASFGLDKDHPMMDINISTQILWLDAAHLLDPNLFKILNHFNITKPLDAQCSIIGDMNAKGDPEIIVDAQIKDNVLVTQDGTVTDCNFSGRYINNFKNGLGYNDINSAVIVKNFTGNYEGIPVNIPIAAINNLEKPIATGDLHSKFDVEKLGSIFGEDVFKFNGGTANVDFKFNVDIVALRISKPRFTGKVNIINANLLYKPKNLAFLTNILLDFTDEALHIRNIKYQRDKNIVFLDGKIDNFLNLYYDDPENMVAVLNLKSPFMDLKKLMSTLAYSEKKARVKKVTAKGGNKKRIALLQKCQVVLNLNLDKMVYANLTAKKAKIIVVAKNRQFFIKHGSIETCGGEIAFASQLIPQSDFFNVKANVNITTVDIPQFLTSFKNFGITSFKPKNINGNLSANVDLSLKMTANGDLVDESANGNLQYDIKKGSLTDFKPIMKVGKFAFPNRDVKHIVFNDLSGRLNMDGSKVNVDYFKVSSNVLNFDVEGIYSFKKGTNLGLTIPLRNPEDDFKIKDKKERAAKRYKGIVLHLLVVDGKDGEMKIKMGSLPDKNKVTVK